MDVFTSRPDIRVALLAGCLLPFGCASASTLSPAFHATNTTIIDLSEGTHFDFSSFTIDAQAAVSFAPAFDGLIEIYTSGDITIDGSLQADTASLFLNSTEGSIFINGQIQASSITLQAGTMDLDNGSYLLLSGGSIQTRDPGSILIGDPGTITLQPVPLPPAIWLMLSSIPILFGTRHSLRFS